MAKVEVPICQNPACHKPMLNKRKDAKYCSPRCRAEVKAAEAAEQPNLWTSAACRYPNQQQAEIVVTGNTFRHPFGGKRPEWSGYCTMASKCGCDKDGCHGVGEFAVEAIAS